MAEMQPEVEEQAEPSGAFCVEIHFNQGGTIKVGVEPLEGAQEEEQETNYQTVANIQAAVKLVQDIYANGGQTADPAAQAMQEGHQ